MKPESDNMEANVIKRGNLGRPMNKSNHNDVSAHAAYDTRINRLTWMTNEIRNARQNYTRAERPKKKQRKSRFKTFLLHKLLFECVVVSFVFSRAKNSCLCIYSWKKNKITLLALYHRHYFGEQQNATKRNIRRSRKERKKKNKTPALKQCLGIAKVCCESLVGRFFSSFAL